MIVADDARDFPGAVFVLPEVNETGFAHAFGVLMPRVVEAVDAHFDSAVSLHVMDLQCSGDEFASSFAANVFLHALRERSFAKSDTALVVIELDVVGEERRKLFQVAPIVGVEESCIKRGNGFVEFWLRFDVVERRHGLSANSRDTNCKQEQKHDDF